MYEPVMMISSIGASPSVCSFCATAIPLTASTATKESREINRANPRVCLCLRIAFPLILVRACLNFRSANQSHCISILSLRLQQFTKAGYETSDFVLMGRIVLKIRD